MNGDHGKYCRISLTAPGEVEMMRNYSDEERMELAKSLKALPEMLPQ